MKPNRQSETGFTLIEVLVALAVLGVGAVSMLAAAQAHAVRIAEIRDRTVARWVADNRLAGIRLGLFSADSDAEEEEMMGQTWIVTSKMAPTSDEDLGQVDIRVSPSDSGSSLYVLTGYIDVGTGGSQ